MAHFVPLDSYKTVQVTSPSTTLDVQYVTCETTPHGLGFAYAVPYDSWVSGAGNDLLDVIAIDLEGIWTSGKITGSIPVQDLDASGLLTDFVDITVSYDRTAQGLPPLTGIAEVPILAFFTSSEVFHGFSGSAGKSPQEYVDEEYNRLKQLASG